MFKFAFFLGLLSLMLVSVQADALDNTDRSYAHVRCPCQCLLGPKKRAAIRMCNRVPKFRIHCTLTPCKPHYASYHDVKGIQCCNKVKPSVSSKPTQTATATPTPTPTPTSTATATPTPTPTPKPKCPCQCIRKYFATSQCASRPHCQVSKCPTKHVPFHPHGYIHEKFECCDKPHHH